MNGYLGEVKFFAGTYPPKDWAFCDGQMLAIQSYPALYSVMGNQYGGDGVNNFALPDLRGRANVGSGQGTGLTYRYPGSLGGFETVQITEYSMPAHSHSVKCDVTTPADNADTTPAANLFAKKTSKGYGSDETGNPTMNDDMVVTQGGSYPHLNMPPYSVLNHIICIQGIYPPRS